ncbi:CDF family Co(II)/Ni(II) efflux transporter DmeF [Paludibacterium denitrificans]|uniref:CDF family Co(II)/Ni(II) efflux transporter DmeF n=1 Tax=Paludibacterium denitrificans TaxID=2675226 RepID=A0A844GGK1_9NEIS|nr:CDF family Co(II)/Ni(II) efflux transporter DmeF [Paludibacterium denitrificans]MTD33804.1 CDF family Co(II)/Ni(II) efflux transporter DmeF [Paludibacterium denitrificans]
MLSQRAEQLRHSHVYGQDSRAAERKTRLVMWITLIMMVVEIVAGWRFNSMALLADGWHMSSHAVAIGLSAYAYATARKHAADPRFAFGSWKIEILGGFASALFLLGVALMMAIGSVERLLQPQTINFDEAIAIAILGLVVNLVCAGILGHDHSHDHGHSHHDHGHGHDHHQHGHEHHDLNLKSAYIHVVADAATSVLAIAALFGGKLYQWNWLDPIMGVVGAILVGIWAKGLLLDTGRILLDREMDAPVTDEIRQVLQADWPHQPLAISDLHVWRVGKEHYACIVSVVTHDSQLTPDHVKQALSIHEELVHITVEIHHVPSAEAHDGHHGS